MSGDAQQMLPNPIREWLVKFIDEQTGVTNPLDIRFVWARIGAGVVTFADETASAGFQALAIDGADADALREIETGREPDTRSKPWELDERRAGPRR